MKFKETGTCEAFPVIGTTERLAGCSHVNASHSYFLKQWEHTTSTVTELNMKHVSEIKKHECMRAHMDNTIKLAKLGRVSITTQLDEGHRISSGGQEQTYLIKDN